MNEPKQTPIADAVQQMGQEIPSDTEIMLTMQLQETCAQRNKAHNELASAQSQLKLTQGRVSRLQRENGALQAQVKGLTEKLEAFEKAAAEPKVDDTMKAAKPA